MLEVVSYLKLDSTPNPNVPCNRPWRDKSIVGVNSSLVAQRETVLQVAIDTSFKKLVFLRDGELWHKTALFFTRLNVKP